jgi:AcrR family transcriptional regulator
MSMSGKAGKSAAAKRGGKRARTRAALIEAATELVLEKGYEATTLEEVARRAGMTTGAIYGNFRNKEELFMAISVMRGGPVVPEFPPNATLAEKMRVLADAVIEEIPSREAAAIGMLSFRIYALQHPKMLAKLRAETAEIYARGAAWIERETKGDDLPMPPDVLIPVMRALADGLWLQRFLTPELVTNNVIRAAFAALAGERTAKSKRRLRRSPAS